MSLPEALTSPVAPRKLPERGHLPREEKQGSTLCIMVLGPVGWDEGANESRTSHPEEAGTLSCQGKREF